MSEPTLFRRSFVRGLNAELIRTGAVAYPSKEAADHAADYIADRAGMPDPFTNPEAVTHKIAADLCVMLKQASDVLCKEAGGYQPELSKTAAAADPVDVAVSDTRTLMQKVAYETEAPNTAEEAARNNEAAALDQRHRPEGYANSGVGNYEEKGEGAVGVEKEQPRADGVMGQNSAVENSKAAQLLGKLANAPYQSAPNTPQNAAQNNEAAALDQHNRPENYANVGVNKSKVTVPAGATIGVEQKISRPNSPAGSNTATGASKTASEILFEKTASRVIPFMLQGMGDKEKVAHVQALMGLTKKAQAKYLFQMYGSYGVDKTAAEQYATAYLKQAEAEGEEDDDMAVARAMEQAAAALEGESKEEAEEAKEESEEDGAKEAAFKGLRGAIQRLRG